MYFWCSFMVSEKNLFLTRFNADNFAFSCFGLDLGIRCLVRGSWFTAVPRTSHPDVFLMVWPPFPTIHHFRDLLYRESENLYLTRQTSVVSWSSAVPLGYHSTAIFVIKSTFFPIVWPIHLYFSHLIIFKKSSRLSIKNLCVIRFTETKADFISNDD